MPNRRNAQLGMMFGNMAMLVLVANAFPVWADNWPMWRGPHADGASRETGIAWKWSPDGPFAWKQALPDGASSPCIWGDALFVTAQEADQLLLLRLDANTGAIVWRKAVATGSLPTSNKTKWTRGDRKFHKLHNLASPSPTTNGTTVVVHYGTGFLAAFDFAGQERWRHQLQEEYGPYTDWWGHSNSPVIVGDLVVSVNMNDSLADVSGAKLAESYVVAHDLKNGAVRWKTPRMTGAKAEECDSYTTPLVRTVDGKVEVVVMGGNQLDAYDPATGKQLWFLPLPPNLRTITGPTFVDDLIVTTIGFRKSLLGVRVNGTGQLANTAIQWRVDKNTSDTPYPVPANGLVFWVTDNGFASAADAKTGEVKWTERLQGDFKSSPLAVDGRVYFTSLAGKTTVVKAAAMFEKLAENKLDDEIIASAAVANGKLYLRGRKALYCVYEASGGR